MSNPTWLWAIRNGVMYDLTGAGILFQEHGDGFGLPPHHRFTQRGPQQHGATNRDFRLDPRPLTLIAGFARLCEADVYAARRMLLDIFKPSNIPIQLRWDLSSGQVRQIDVFYDGSMTLPLHAAAAGGIRSQNQSGQTPIGQSGGVYQRTAIELIAEDPTFYDPNTHVATLTNGNVGSGLTVPMPVPFSVGSGIFDSGLTLAYAGDWQTYPVIGITGPINDPVITNVTTGEVLNLTGTNIGPGETWVIDLGYEAKTVVDNTGANQIAALTTDSDLGTWHLAASPDAATVFPNIIQVTGTAAGSQTNLTFTYADRYIGF